MSTPAEKITALVSVVPAGETPLEANSLEQAMKLSSTFAPSALLPTHLRNRPADVLITILHGKELGLTPMQALNGIFVVEGKPSVSAQMAVALVKRRADVCEFFACVESTADHATYETQRRGEPRPVRLTFTMVDAARANLAERPTWKRYPAAMLRNRCSLALARDVYPDLVAGLYDQDEVEDFRSSASAPGFVAPPIPPGAGPVVPPAPNGNATAPATPAPPPGSAPTAADVLTVETGKAAIAAAATIADLQAVQPRIPAALKADLKATFVARWRELEAAEKAKATAPAPSPATAPPVEAPPATTERQPGEDG